MSTQITRHNARYRFLVNPSIFLAINHSVDKVLGMAVEPTLP